MRSGIDATTPPRDASASLDDGSAPIPPDDGGAIPEPPTGVVVCGGGVCAEGQECCLLDGRCVAPGDASCAVPPDTTDPDACVRASDCDAGEYCGTGDDGAITGLCGGAVGRCEPMRPPSECGGFGDGVCGCDGRTYPDPCAASRAGVRVSLLSPCGVDAFSNYHQGCENDAQCAPNGHCDAAIGECVREDPHVACGIDEQCPPGRECCGVTGFCYDPARPATCAVPPEGTSFPCQDDTDCWRADGSWWQFGWPTVMGDSFCGGPGCGPGGGCMTPGGDCPGVLEPVCGCDGATYTNACEAQHARVRVEHDGGC